MSRKKILIIEDEEDIRKGIRTLLDNSEYIFNEAENGEKGLAVLSEDTDLVILDIMLPGIDGFEVCRQIREQYLIPIILLSEKTHDEDIMTGLKMGADDYLTKPFSYMELNARVKALLRRYYIYRGREEREFVPDSEYIEIDGIKISMNQNEVLLRNKQIHLTETEYKILLMLMRRSNRALSTKMIFEEVWREPFYYGANTIVMVHVKNIRRKIEKDPKNPVHVITVWGKGYRFTKQNYL